MLLLAPYCCCLHVFSGCGSCFLATLLLLAEHTIRSPAAPPPFSDALKPVGLLLGSPGKEA